MNCVMSKLERAAKMFQHCFSIKQKALQTFGLQGFYVVVEGLEPSQAEPESEVLPLHYTTVRTTPQR